MEKVNEPTKSGIKFIKAGELKAGDSISGTYEGQMEADQFDKENYKIRAADGTLQVLNQTSQLTRLLDQVDVGNEVKIVYQGKIVTNKGNPLHTFEVFQERAAAKAASTANSAPKKNALPF
jgi:hypothetical protein